MVLMGIFEILNFRFLTFFFTKISISPLYPMGKPKIPIISKKQDLRAKRNAFGIRGQYFNIHGSVQGNLVHLRFFRKYDFQMLLLLHLHPSTLFKVILRLFSALVSNAL